MWQDPIVAETRALREEYAKLFNHDRAAILADIARREAMPGKVLVSRQENLSSLSALQVKANSN